MNTSKRPFEALSEAEKAALEMVYANAHQPIPRCSTGLGELAQRLTGNDRLRASSPEAQVFIQLGREGWIVRKPSPVRLGLGTYNVADDYPAMQSAS